MKKYKASSGQNGQLVHWWLLVHFSHHGVLPSFPRLLLQLCVVVFRIVPFTPLYIFSLDTWNEVLNSPIE
jgi:hypothetical protein